jgi:hypothetical protein
MGYRTAKWLAHLISMQACWISMQMARVQYTQDTPPPWAQQQANCHIAGKSEGESSQLQENNVIVKYRKEIKKKHALAKFMKNIYKKYAVYGELQ